MFDWIPAGTPCFAHRSNRALHDAIRAYVRSWPNLALRRSDAALERARLSDHSVAQTDPEGNVLGVSLPIEQCFISQAVTWCAVNSVLEVVFHHHDRAESAAFLARTVLPRQVALLTWKYPDVLIYMVVGRGHGHVDILEAHGWTAFEPEFELILSREQTGARCRPTDLWYRAPGG